MLGLLAVAAAARGLAACAWQLSLLCFRDLSIVAANLRVGNLALHPEVLLRSYGGADARPVRLQKSIDVVASAQAQGVLVACLQLRSSISGQLRSGQLPDGEAIGLAVPPSPAAKCEDIQRGTLQVCWSRAPHAAGVLTRRTQSEDGLYQSPIQQV